MYIMSQNAVSDIKANPSRQSRTPRQSLAPSHDSCSPRNSVCRESRPSKQPTSPRQSKTPPLPSSRSPGTFGTTPRLTASTNSCMFGTTLQRRATTPRGSPCVSSISGACTPRGSLTSRSSPNSAKKLFEQRESHCIPQEDREKQVGAFTLPELR